MNSTSESVVADHQGIESDSRRVPLASLGLLLAMFSAAAFVAMRMPQLPVHFQVDGQLAEYLAWSKAPDAIGNSFNQELNPRLFSVYYPAMAYACRYFDRLDVLRGAFAIELILLAAAVCYLGMTLTRNALAGALASIAVIWGNGMATSLGGSSGVGLVCNPEFPATAAICVALALSWQRRHVFAALVAGLAFNIHGSIALFGAVMICVAALIDGWQRFTFRRSIVACFVCVASAAPTVAWVLTAASPARAASIDTWLHFPRWIYPHHVFVSATPLEGWLRLAVYLAPGILGWAAMRSVYRKRLGIVQGWIFAALLLLSIGFVFVEVWPIRFVAQLTLWRGTRFVQFVALVIGLRWLIDLAQSGGLRAALGAIALTGFLAPFDTAMVVPAQIALALLILIVASDTKGIGRWLAVALWGVTVGLIAFEQSGLWTLSAYLAPRWFAIVAAMVVIVWWASRKPESIRPVCIIVFAVAACLFVNRVGAVQTFDGIQRQRAAALLELAPAIHRACPEGMTVIAPPDLRNPGAWADRGSFLCRQQLTAYAYGPWLVDPLMERMRWYLGKSDQFLMNDEPILRRLLEGYRSRPSAAFDDLHERYGVGVAIVELEQCLDFREVAENDVFRVYDLSAPLGELHAKGNVVE